MALSSPPENTAGLKTRETKARASLTSAAQCSVTENGDQSGPGKRGGSSVEAHCVRNGSVVGDEPQIRPFGRSTSRSGRVNCLTVTS